MSKRFKDPILDYYRKLTKSNYLHYGYWNLEDKLNIECLHLAQERYINYLISFIPTDVKTILDVGCGIGGNTLRLLEEGFKVEALSPDTAQEKAFLAKGKAPFHLSKFENFDVEQTYDLILMSESAQYIPIKKGMEKCSNLLNDGGSLLISDYFLREKFEKDNIFSVSTHYKDEYLKAAEEYGFEIVKSEDITSKVTPTLDLAMLKFKEYVKPTLQLFDELLLGWSPTFYKIVKLIGRKQLNNLENQIQLIDSQLFVKHRQYMIYLFKLNK